MLAHLKITNLLKKIICHLNIFKNVLIDIDIVINIFKNGLIFKNDHIDINFLNIGLTPPPLLNNVKKNCAFDTWASLREKSFGDRITGNIHPATYFPVHPHLDFGDVHFS